MPALVRCDAPDCKKEAPHSRPFQWLRIVEISKEEMVWLEGVNVEELRFCSLWCLTTWATAAREQIEAKTPWASDQVDAREAGAS